MSVMVIAVVLTALLFDFTNGFHDTANAMATSIASGALQPRAAVLLAGALNLIGAFVSVQVALTISSGLVDEARITPAVVFGGLVGAVLWNLVSWLLGLPSSSSHALFGGLIGATWVFAGSGAIKLSNVVGKVLVPLALSPIVAGVVALAATSVAYRIARRTDPGTVVRGFRTAQVVSSSMIALAHGTNDAQKTMGVITLTLTSVGLLPAHAAPPLWVITAAGLAIAAGTAMGGWRIIRTLGRRISDIESPQGFAAETTSTAVILSATHFGFALSTTHVTTGAVLGSAAGRPLAVVRWSMAARMAAVWLLTLPAAATVGALAGWVAARGTTGTVLVAVVMVAVAGVIYGLSRRRPVTASTFTSPTVNDAPIAPPVPVPLSNSRVTEEATT
jgi:inorganic phosphate transporter, PiT family